MGFISYSLDFYKKELQILETSPATEAAIYRAKQLLKILDDLIDEGYTVLNQNLEEAYQGVSRLRKYLEYNHAEPFKLSHKPVVVTDATYGQESLELAEAVKAVSAKAENSKDKSDDVFLRELQGFCEWIGYEEDTAYIFLLRDALLPYIFYQSQKRDEIYPWLLGRKTLALLTGRENVDDEIRASIIKALEYGQCQNFTEFCNIVLPDIRKTLSQYPEIVNCLEELLKEIKKKHIIVVESGCSGTFPMLLMSVDKRIDVRMYTTYPYLSDIYGDKIYTPKYEENRLFESLYSQDLYFQFSDLKNGHFYVKQCKNKEVEKKALAEIKTMLH